LKNHARPSAIAANAPASSGKSAAFQARLAAAACAQPRSKNFLALIVSNTPPALIVGADCPSLYLGPALVSMTTRIALDWARRPISYF
jgi:hypothetical protein